MAITFKLDPAQMEQLGQLTTAINALSDNLAKWEGAQNEVIKRGLNDIVVVLGGGGEDGAEQIQQIADSVKNVRQKLQTSVDTQTKGD
jgi:hypothetical protein